MKVRFLVAGMGDTPSGGVRIIYEHANRLAERGHDVRIDHAAIYPGFSVRAKLREIRKFLKFKMQNSSAPWMNVSPQVHVTRRLVASLDDVRSAERLIATFYATHFLFDDDILKTSPCFLFIQGYETYLVSEDILHAQWRSASVNIVVSRWLQELVTRVSGQAFLVPNAIDREFFKPVSDKRSGRLKLLFCSIGGVAKGSRDLIAALNSIDADIDIVAFGHDDPAELGLIKPHRFVKLPAQTVLRQLYSEADVFVATGHTEGWGLTVAEATACGAAVIVSDAEGHFEFLRPNHSALFFHAGDAGQIREQIEKLNGNRLLIAQLATNALSDLAPFSWDRSTMEMERVLLNGPALV